MIIQETTTVFGPAEGMLGILATILALLVLANNSNLIYSRLRRYTLDSKKEIISLYRRVEKVVEDIRNMPEYGQLKEKLTDEDLDPSNVQKILDLPDDLSTKFSHDVMTHYTNELDAILKSPEIVLTPLYMLIYIILLLMGNIIEGYLPSWKFSIVCFEYGFLLMSKCDLKIN